MKNMRLTVWGLFLAASLAALVLFAGCRAFEPEAVMVNKAPETYIIGAPMEYGGGYYHFHVYWYGSDQDGVVERFVWALTDTTKQDRDTSEDEEDQNFNPALDASQLAIGHWTTKTDSIFDFTIDQGTKPSYDMTLHMVAVDDFGDFDRTPARLYFFSNSLGNPEIRFFRISGTDTIPFGPNQTDTVGFGYPYQVYWAGSTPNVRGYDPVALALVDTVLPYTDGLFGYKWLLTGALGGNCVPSLTDCWHPRLFNEATGDSFSYFGNVRSLTFDNDTPGHVSPFRKLLPSGPVTLNVNSVDVAGVEVQNELRDFTFYVNYDPETILLNKEQDWAHPEDPEIYPYYTLLNDPTQTHYPFGRGETIPDRSYVVFKALAKDSNKDLPQNLDYKIGLVGSFKALRSNFLGGDFPFQSAASPLDVDPTWDASPDGWYADTLGFLVAPRTRFTFQMQAQDEHTRRDNTPDTLSFFVGKPPCLQCIELQNTVAPSAFGPDLECYDPTAGLPHPCFGDTVEYFLKATDDAAEPGRDYLDWVGAGYIAVNKTTGYAQIVDNFADYVDTHYMIESDFYGLYVLLHGQDDAEERYANPVYRMMAWKYEIDNDCDPYNQIQDAGGRDDINEATWGEQWNPGLQLEQSSGLWRLTSTVAVPKALMGQGVNIFQLQLQYVTAGGDVELAAELWDACIRQLGLGRVQAVALDQTLCGNASPYRPATYYTFKTVRPPIPTSSLPGITWRSCNASIPNIDSSLSLAQGAMSSLVYDSENHPVPATNYFRLTVQTKLDELVTCSGEGF